MSFEVRIKDVELLCNLFSTDVPDVDTVCARLRLPFETTEDNIQKWFDFEVDSPTTALILAARQAFLYYAKWYVENNIPENLNEIALSRANEYVLMLEDAQFASQNFLFRNAFGEAFGTGVEYIDIRYNDRIVRDMKNAKNKLDNYLTSLKEELGDGTQLTKMQIEMLDILFPGSKVVVKYEDFASHWNHLVTQRFLQKAQTRTPPAFQVKLRDFLAKVQFHLFPVLLDLYTALKFIVDSIPTAVAKSLAGEFINVNDPDYRKLSDAEIRRIEQKSKKIKHTDLLKLRVAKAANVKFEQAIEQLEPNGDLSELGRKLKKDIQLFPEVNRRRKLNTDEINNLAEVIQFPTTEPRIASVTTERVRSTLEKQLVKIELEPEYVAHLKSIMSERFQGALIPEGHPIGMIASQALGENASQAGLRSFHHAGITGDTGFDRIKSVTDLPSVEKSKNPFTSIALKGQPSRYEAEVYAHKIEDTRLGDICEIVVGRGHANVPEMSEFFGHSPVFEAEQNGWQNTYINLLKVFGLDETSARGSFQRPDWVIRLIFDKDKMFQRRISMMNIVEVIEQPKSDLRVLISDINTGIAEVCYTGGRVESLEGDEKNQEQHSYLMNNVIPILKEIKIQGVVGFTKTIVEKYTIVSFITETSAQDNLLIVKFSHQDILLNGVPEFQIISLIATKAKVPRGNVRHVGKSVYQAFGMTIELKEFRDRLRAPEVVELSSLVSSTEWGNGDAPVSLIRLDREIMRLQNEVSVEDVLNFFQHQNDLPVFSSVEIEFDRSNLVVMITDAADFNPADIYERIKRFLPEADPEYQDNSFTIKVNAEDDLDPVEIVKRDYQDCLELDVGLDGKLKVTLIQADHKLVWEKLTVFDNGCLRIPTTFTAEKRDKDAHRYRILARGVGTAALSKLYYVNIYATIPSVPWEIFNYFDIEATACYIQSELVLNGGAEIGNRHLGLVADTLTYIGYPIKMKKSGKEAQRAGVLATASFQEAFSVTIDMAAGNVHDELKSSVGMTFKGDFSQAEVAAKRKIKEEAIDSGIAILTNSTISTRSAKKVLTAIRSAPPQIVKPKGKSLLNDPDLEPPEGAL